MTIRGLLVLFLSISSVASAGDYYDHGSFPATNSLATSASMRAELDLIAAGFAKFPTFSGNANKPLILNGGGTGYTFTTGTLALGGSFAISGAYATTLTVTGNTGVTLPTTGTLATLAGTETLTGKTLNLSSNTLTGTIAQFNTAVSDADLATLAGTETLTNKTITAPILSGTVTGTYRLAGTGTIADPILSGTIAGTYVFAGAPSFFTPLPIASGGFGLGTLASHSLYAGNGTGTPSAISVGATNTVLHGNTGLDPSFSAIVESDIALADNTSNNVNSTKHGFAPKSPNDATKFLNGAATPAWATPAGTLVAGSTATKNPVAFSTQTTTAHNLGGQPALVYWYLECLTAEWGYSIGDRIVGSGWDSNGTIGMAVSHGAVNIDISIGSGIAVTPKGAGSAPQAITAANWKVVAVPYKIN